MYFYRNVLVFTLNKVHHTVVFRTQFVHTHTVTTSSSPRVEDSMKFGPSFFLTCGSAGALLLAALLHHADELLLHSVVCCGRGVRSLRLRSIQTRGQSRPRCQRTRGARLRLQNVSVSTSGTAASPQAQATIDSNALKGVMPV